MYTYNTPPESFVLFYAYMLILICHCRTPAAFFEIYIKTSVINNLLSKDPQKTGYINQINKIYTY